MDHSTVHSELERLAALSDPDRRTAAARLSIPEDLVLVLIDEVRDVVMSDLDRAMTQATVLRDIADAAGQTVARARARTALAHSLNYANRFADALSELENADAIARGDGLELERAQVSLTRVQSLARLGRFDEAILSCEHAERVFRENAKPESELRAVTNHAILLRMLGRWAESVERFDLALELAADDPQISAQIQSNRAESLLELGRFRLAEAAFRESCASLERAGLTRVATIVRGNLADLLGRQGRYSEAIEQFELARRFFETDRAVGDLARLEAELADVLASVGLMDDAAEMYGRSERALESVGLSAERARSLIGLATAQFRSDPDRANASLESAEAIYATLGNHHGRMMARLLRGRIALLQDNLPAAESYASSEGDSATEDEAPSLRLFRRLLVADLRFAAGDYGPARSIIEKAIREASSLSLPSILADLHHRLARVCHANGDLAESVSQYRRVMQHLDRMRGTLRGDRLRAAFLGERHGVFAEAIGAVLDAGGPSAFTDAFDISERGRSRSLLDLLRGDVEIADQVARATKSADESRLLGQLAERRAALNYQYSRLSPTEGVDSGRPVSEWFEELRSIESQVSRLETRLSATRVGRGLLAIPQRGEQIAASLEPDQAVLSYSRCGKSFGCFVLRRRGIEFVDLGISADGLESMVGMLSFQLRRALIRAEGTPGRSSSRQSAAVKACTTLHNAVLAPTLPLLDGVNRLMCVPGADLHGVPFAALHDGDRFLVERFGLTCLPSASVLETLLEGETEPPRTVAVVGVPDRFAPQIEHEARAVAETLGDQEPLIGAVADKASVIRRLETAGIIHLATHGVFPPGNPLAAAIKLHDAWLTAREIFSLELHGAAVTLSGCETGRSEIDPGEEIYGFVRAFLAAGAGGVVSSLWASHDASARELMTNMYAMAPEQGFPAARLFRGLRDAQRHAIGKGVHPGLWSGFISIGAA